MPGPVRPSRSLRAPLIFAGLLAACALGCVAVTWQRYEIDDDSCWFDFQCRDEPGFAASTCTSWGTAELSRMRCTLSCIESAPRPCPAGLRCVPATLSISEGNQTLLSVPLAACHH